MNKRSVPLIGMVVMFGPSLALLPFSARAEDMRSVDATPSFHSLSDGGSVSIDIQLADGLIYMQATLNGSKPLWMMLDTGSSVTVLDESVSKALGLRSYGEGDAYGPGQGSSQKLAFASHARLRFAGVELSDQTVATLPLDWFSREVGRSTDGFLSSDIFRRFVVEIDYANQVLRLYDPAVFSYPGSGQRLPLDFAWDNIPRVRAEVVAPDGRSIPGIFLVDTGSTPGFWLTKEFSDAHPEFLSAEKTIEAPSVVVVGGEIRSRVGRVPAIRLGEIVIREPATTFSQNTSGTFAAPHLAGVIGAQILSRFTVIFDYPHGQMILQPNAHFGDAEAEVRNGLDHKSSNQRTALFAGGFHASQKMATGNRPGAVPRVWRFRPSRSRDLPIPSWAGDRHNQPPCSSPLVGATLVAMVGGVGG